MCSVCDKKKSTFLKQVKNKNSFYKLYNMLYCLKCKKQTNEACPKRLIMITNIKIMGVSRRAKCLAVKLFAEKVTDNDQLETVVTQFLLDWIL